MGVRYLLTRLALGPSRADRLRAREETAAIRHLPDRRLLASAYGPAVARGGGRILWIGTRPYTAETSAALADGGGEVWTSDIDPAAARWGQAGRHRTGDACDIDRLFGDLTFDVVLFNGVFGFGLNAPEAQQRALRAIAAILRPGGLLLLGWNDDRVEDPLTGGAVADLYAPRDFAGQPARVHFADSTHVYDALRRLGPAAIV